MSKERKHPFIVTIDGPAASGKTSVSRGVATRLGWAWVSTGAFYRGLAVIAKLKGVDLDREDAVVEVIAGSDWEVKMTEENTLVFLQGEDVTDQIYGEAAGAGASKVSQYPKVRAALLEAQRNCANDVKGLVAEGRDCGTVVFPSAPVKIYLTAKSESRAQRRAKEEGVDVEKVIKKQSQRDAQDSGRQAAPMQVPEQAHVLDSSEMSLEEVVEKVDSIVRQELALV